jgi:2'-hydroxyisoflavone reductase
MRRRDFIAAGAAAAAAGAIRPQALLATVPPASKPLRILFLGGTGFIGPHQVGYAIKRGHQVTLFNRGRTNAALFPEAEKLEGDRNGKLDALKGKTWDAVIDNSGYVPRHVRDSAQLLSQAAGQYLFVSTAGIYQAFTDGSWPKDGTGEDAPKWQLAEPGSEDVGKYYGPLKWLCEQEVAKAFPKTATVVRPGLIVGPGDPTDRFTYWPIRVAKGGEMVAPGSASDPILYIDARDLGIFCVHLLETHTAGTYNLIGPKGTLTMGELLDTSQKVTQSSPTLTWVPGSFLEAQGVHYYGLFPWLDPKGKGWGGSHFKRDRAFAAGLTFRPLGDTVRDTVEWFRTLPAERQAKMVGGLQPEQEAKILAAWRASKSG